MAVKNPSANACLMQKTRVRPLGSEDPLEKEMVTHFSPGEGNGNTKEMVFLPGKSHEQRSLAG